MYFHDNCIRSEFHIFLDTLLIPECEYENKNKKYQC